MNESYTIVAVLSAALAGLLIVYIKGYGRGLGIGVWFARVVWVLPIILALYPKVRSTELPETTYLQPIKVLLDDSQSIKANSESVRHAEESIDLLKKQCLSLGCSVEVTNLSELEPTTKKGFTPLIGGLLTFLERNKTNPWLLLTDGGDYKPKVPLPVGSLRESVAKKNRGLVLGLGTETKNNYWLASVAPPPLSFEGQSTSVSVTIRRSKENTRKNEQLQLQLLGDQKIIHSQNLQYNESDEEVVVNMVVPGLGRGHHLLTLRLLPVAGENVTWDNEVNFDVEVLANTIGILHLLGSPSWDGRFLRRYFKAEPKYDLISFFILRDRWDSQAVSERELSLIPFPVDRLFNEELPNFKVVVIQNFALFEFLQTEYQENLVKFVKNGGGLLFLGGPRALGQGDVVGSQLAEILPFKYENKSRKENSMNSLLSGLSRGRNGRTGMVFDSKKKFRIELAKVSNEKREFASLIDQWEQFKDGLEEAGNLKGLHDMSKAKFSEGEHTTLMHAKGADGKKWPLAVASYPGKGRAIWLFSDSFWRFSTAQKTVRTRNVHQQFFSSAMNWLLRQENKQPLYLSGFHIDESENGQAAWSVYVKGPAAKYFNSLGKWGIEVCGIGVDLTKTFAQPTGHDEYRLSGFVPFQTAAGTLCRVELKAVNKAFGSVVARAANVVPKRFLDKDLGRVESILEGVASATGAQLLDSSDDYRQEMRTWLVSNLGAKQLVVPTRTETRADHFWFFNIWFILLIPLGMIAEVVLRRWIARPLNLKPTSESTSA